MSVATYPDPGVVTVILLTAWPTFTTTVATAPVPVPPVKETFVYVLAVPSDVFVVIEATNASAVVNNLPLVCEVVKNAVNPDPVPLVALCAKLVGPPTDPPVPPDV